MSFRDDFLVNALSSDIRLIGEDSPGVEPTEESLILVEDAVRRRLESSLERVAERQSHLFLAEVQYMAQNLDKQTGDLAGDSGPARTTLSELAAEIQTYCDYLGPQFCSLRWTLERHVSEKTVKAELYGVESFNRETFEKGVKFFDLKNPEFAGPCFKELLALNPGQYMPHQYLGFIAVYEDDAGEATAQFERAYKHAPDSRQRALALSHSARTKFALGKPDLAADFAKAATQAFDKSAGLWYEHALYASAAGDSATALKALSSCIQLDWNFWAIAAADPSLEAVRSELLGMMDGIRQSTSQSARIALDRLAVVVRAVASAFGPEYRDELTWRRNEYEENFAKNNIYLLRQVLSGTEVWRGKVLSSARDLVREKISIRATSLRGADSRLETLIDQIRGPIDALLAEEERLRTSFQPWQVRFGTYALLWLAYTGATFGVLRPLGWNDLYVFPYIVSFAVPFIVPAVINKIRHRGEVDRPAGKLQKKVLELEKEARPQIAKLQREHIERKKRLEMEIEELGVLREKLAKIE